MLPTWLVQEYRVAKVQPVNTLTVKEQGLIWGGWGGGGGLGAEAVFTASRNAAQQSRRPCQTQHIQQCHAYLVLCACRQAGLHAL